MTDRLINKMNKYYATIVRNSNTINYLDTLSGIVNVFILSKDPNTLLIEFQCPNPINMNLRTSMRTILCRINNNIIPQVCDEHGNIVSIDETAEDTKNREEALYDKMEHSRCRRRDRW